MRGQLLSKSIMKPRSSFWEAGRPAGCFSILVRASKISTKQHRTIASIACASKRCPKPSDQLQDGQETIFGIEGELEGLGSHNDCGIPSAKANCKERLRQMHEGSNKVAVCAASISRQQKQFYVLALNCMQQLRLGGLETLLLGRIHEERVPSNQ